MKIVAALTGLLAAIASLIKACSPATGEVQPPPAPPQPFVFVIPVPANQTTPSAMPPATPSLTAAPRAIVVYMDRDGGTRLASNPPPNEGATRPVKVSPGRQIVTTTITDPAKLVDLILNNGILIDRYLKKINAAAAFERAANRANLEKVVDWTSFIAESAPMLSGYAGTPLSKEFRAALKHADNLEYYKTEYLSAIE